MEKEFKVKEFEVKYFYQNNVLVGAINLFRLSSGETLIEYIDDSEKWEDKDAHLFLSFCRLRNYLSSKDKLLLCKGCRKDVYPSGSQLKWIYAFLLRKGIRINPEKDEVMIFEEELERNKIASVEEQELFYHEWLSSIEGLPY